MLNHSEVSRKCKKTELTLDYGVY